MPTRGKDLSRSLKVRLRKDEWLLFACYAKRQEKSMSAMIRAAVKAEIRRHGKHVRELARLLEMDDQQIIAALTTERAKWSR